MRLVLLGQFSLFQRDGPGDGGRLVRQVQERVLALGVGGPVVVHEVRVGGAVLERLERVAHPARE